MIPGKSRSTAALRAAVDRLVRRVSQWDAARWAKRIPVDRGVTNLPPRRSEIMYALVQELADVAADSEHRTRRVVPRLDNPLALPDQLRVMAADITDAAPADDVLDHAAGLVTRVSRLL